MYAVLLVWCPSFKVEDSMQLKPLVKAILKRFKIRPRTWLLEVESFFSFRSYLGTIKPYLVDIAEDEFVIRREMLDKSWRIKELAAPLAKRILALSPHPDDESIGAGGFLLKHREHSEIHFFTLLVCGKGGQLVDRPWVDQAEYKAELRQARRAELAQVGKQVHAKSICYLDAPGDELELSDDNVRRVRDFVSDLKPDAVLLPWFFDNHRDHRIANILYAWACSELDCTVFAYEVWSNHIPNAVLNISDVYEEKLSLVAEFKTQLATIDYFNLVQGLSSMRAFRHPIDPRHGGKAEGYIALPNREYCELVTRFYGTQSRPHHQNLKKYSISVSDTDANR
jgi:LmbE family N-acetylglucosaminyl deacetylase